MTFSETKNYLVSRGIADQQAFNMALRLTQDDAVPTQEEATAAADRAIAARSKPRKPDLFESFGLRMSSNGNDR